MNRRTRRHRALAGAAVAVLGFNAVSHAQVLYEPFNYAIDPNRSLSGTQGNAFTVGGYPDTGEYRWFAAGTTPTGDTTHNTANDAAIVSGSIGSSGLPAAIGNKTSFGGLGYSPRRGTEIPIGDNVTAITAYYSMTLQISALPTDGNGTLVTYLNTATGTQTTNPSAAPGGIFVKPGSIDPTKFVIGISKGDGTGGALAVYDTTEYALNTSVFVVGAFDFVPNVNPAVRESNDVARLWVNPNVADFGAGAAPAATVTDSTGQDLPVAGQTIQSVSLRQGSATFADAVVDELRVDTSWAGVTPRADEQWNWALSGSGAFASNGNWLDSTNTAGVSRPSNATDVALFGSNITGTANVTVASPQTVGALRFDNTNTVNVSGSAITLDTNAAYGELSSLTGSHSVANNITLNDNLLVRVARSSDTLTLSGAISAAGSQGLTKVGGGTVVLGGANTFTGGIKVYNGRVAVSSDANLGAVPGSPTTNIILNTGGLRFDAPMTVNANRGIFIDTVGGTFDTNGNDVTVAGNITGATAGTGLIKAGKGTLTLTGSNSYSRGTFVNGGLLNFANSSAYGSTVAITINANGAAGVSTGTLGDASFHTKVQAASANSTGAIALAASDAASAVNYTASPLNHIKERGTSVGAIGTVTFTGTITPYDVATGYRVGGGGTLVLANTNALTGAQKVSVVNGGTVVLGSTNDYTGTTTIDATKLVLQTSQNSSFSYTLANEAVVELEATGSGTTVLKTGAVSIAGGSKIDLRDNKLITSDSIGTHNGTNYTGVAGLVEAGRNGGFWNAPGITTSMPDATSGSNYTLVGVATGTEVLGINPADTGLWTGQTVSGSDTLVMYTYGGDANLSGFVDIDDYGLIDFNASTGGALTGWYNGDFDYNGIQDIDDYGIIDFVVNIQGAPFATSTGASISAVPEPTAACGLAIFAASLLARRRR